MRSLGAKCLAAKPNLPHALGTARHYGSQQHAAKVAANPEHGLSRWEPGADEANTILSGFRACIRGLDSTTDLEPASE